MSMRKITLAFDADRKNAAGSGKKLAKSLSALVVGGDSIFAGGDEGVTLVRLEKSDGGRRFIERDAIDLREWLDVPSEEPDDDGKVSELDIEGLTLEEDGESTALWLLGSHSFKRGKAEQGKASAANLESLSRVSLDSNRLLLGRLPLARNPHGHVRLAPAPAVSMEGRAAQLDPDSAANPLMRALRRDPLLERFLVEEREIAGKDNGLDLEGLETASGGRVLVGLRGPVLRGIAIVLELAPSRVAGPNGVDRLELEPIGPRGEPYRRHFLDLAGNGVRDLCWDGDDLLVLAGPTMNLDAAPAIFRWTGAAGVIGDGSSEDVRWIGTDIEALDLGVLGLVWKQEALGVDHAESICFLGSDERELVIGYDAPGPNRIHESSHLDADVLRWRS
jgi:hypothetical protein